MRLGTGWDRVDANALSNELEHCRHLPARHVELRGDLKPCPPCLDSRPPALGDQSSAAVVGTPSMQITAHCRRRYAARDCLSKSLDLRNQPAMWFQLTKMRLTIRLVLAGHHFTSNS